MEVNRPDRAARRRRGKSDPVDAQAAARAVQAGEVTVLPKAGTGTVEMLRVLRVARASAMKARTQAINAARALLVTAPPELREQLRGLPAARLLRTAARLEPGRLTSPTAAAMLALRTLACRHQALSAEIKTLTTELERLTAKAAAPLVALFWGRLRQRGRPAGGRRRQPRPAALGGGLLDAVRVLPDRGLLGQDDRSPPPTAAATARQAPRCIGS